MTDKYEALREAAEKVPPGYNYVMDKEEILELLDELAVLRKDAERWQILCGSERFDVYNGICGRMTRKELEKAIDAAREGKK